MSAPAASGDERLLTFEMAGATWALPIARVVEVLEVAGLACVPTLPAAVGGVINFHGDALPVLRAGAVLGVAEAEDAPFAQVLAITDRPSDTARLGLPVARVLGLVRGAAATAGGGDPVAERRSIEGRVTGVLDARRLVQLAREVIEQAHRKSEIRRDSPTGE